jgi:hypothetical protein
VQKITKPCSDDIPLHVFAESLSSSSRGISVAGLWKMISMIELNQEHPMKIQTLLISSLMIAASTAALAQPAAPVAGNPTATPRIDQREANQERRIEQGEKSGQLTPREANRLEAQQDRIRRTEARAKADGVVTPQEREKLTRMQNRASRDIAREKHDGQRDMNHDGRRDRR